MQVLFLKAHPVQQAMSRAATPAELNEDGFRRNPGEPDAAQAEAGEYSKPQVKWRGLTIAIENPAGSVRRGRNRAGVTWEVRMRFDYGEVLGTLGVDGDPVDVIMGPNLDAPMVYVVHQRRYNDWSNYDEDKCCIGFDSQADAEQAFLSNYNDPRFLGPITAMPVDEFVAKVRATKDKPAMIKAILFFKAHVGPYLRGGKMVNLNGYQGRAARGKAGGAGQIALFDEPQHTEPTRELVAEHERLVDVLRSPSHADDKVEAEKQAGELAQYKRESQGVAEGPWKIGRRPFMGNKFSVSQMRRVDGEVRSYYVQDTRTGADALFDTEDEARGVLDSMEKEATAGKQVGRLNRDTAPTTSLTKSIIFICKPS